MVPYLCLIRLKFVPNKQGKIVGQMNDFANLCERVTLYQDGRHKFPKRVCGFGHSQSVCLSPTNSRYRLANQNTRRHTEAQDSEPSLQRTDSTDIAILV